MGTDAGRPEEPAYEAPCRAAARYRTACPLCGRRVTTKVLRYSHKCGRSFFPAVRAAEQRLLAEAALEARMALEPPRAHSLASEISRPQRTQLGGERQR